MKLVNKFLIVVLIIVIGLGLFLTKSELGKDYSKWLKSAFLSKTAVLIDNIETEFLSKINALKVAIGPNIDSDSLFSSDKEPKIDISEIDIESLLVKSVEETVVQEQELFFDIEDNLIKEDSSETILELESESEKQLSLIEIQEAINLIKKQADKIEKEINTLKTLTEIQNNINEITKEVNLLTQEIGNSA